MKTADVLIVGGGPAGMSAAIEAADLGLQSVLVDENQSLGGQIYRQGARAVTAGEAVEATPGDGLKKRVAELADRIDIRSGSAVWAIFEGNQVALTRAGSTELVEARNIIMATGAYEYVPPFPGWTLPGVITPGCAQIMAKTMGVLPGRRILIAGTGPFLLVVACHLLKAGAKIAAVLEASPKLPWYLLPFRCFRTMDILKQGLGYLQTLKKAGVPVRYGRGVVSAEGKDEVHTVVHAPLNGDWEADRARTETEEVDTLCVGYGFVPRVYLAQQAGCELEYRSRIGGWVPRRDGDLRTSMSHLFCAGDGAGVAGALVASLEGRLAGLMAAHQLGAVKTRAAAERRRPIDLELARIGGLRKELDRISAVRPGLCSLVTDETPVCRCEEVPWKEVRDAAQYGGRDFRTLKVMTRVGMGPCQGRFCWPSVSRLLAKELECSVEAIGPPSPRPPVRPVTLEALASESP